MVASRTSPLICLDCLCPHPQGALTGNFVYARELAFALDRSGTWDLALLVDRFTRPVFTAAGLRARLITCEPPIKGKMSDQFAVTAALRQLRPALYHKPTGQLPLTPIPCPAVFTCADLNFKHLPGGRWRRLYKEISYRRALVRAEAVICVSEFTRTEVRRYYPRAEAKVSVVRHGATRLPAADNTTAGAIVAPWFLTFGQHAHKNVEVCLEALAHLRATGFSVPVRLAVVGGGPHIDAVLRPHAAALGVSEQVIFLGRVSDAVLHGLYQRAAGLLFLSHYEGFGLPLLEAMQAGCPVVASNVCAHGEVTGGAATLLAPDDFRSLADAMADLAQGSDLRIGQSRQGRARAALFTWEETARRTSAVYAEVLAGNR